MNENTVRRILEVLESIQQGKERYGRGFALWSFENFLRGVKERGLLDEFGEACRRWKQGGVE